MYLEIGWFVWSHVDLIKAIMEITKRLLVKKLNLSKLTINDEINR